jgi:aspartyl-tRNA(Asn)/glutamyl-tRNA(Gln) amidotransferase subunit A
MSENRVTRRQFSLAMTGGAISCMTSTGNGKESSAASLKDTRDLASLTLAEAASMLRAGRVSSTALVQSCLRRIANEGVETNAFITVMREQAFSQARILDAQAAANQFRSPLHGIPIALKDNIDTAGVRTTWASAVFANRVPEQDAQVVRRLQAAGAIVIGKTNLGELTMDAAAAISHYGPVRNPRALDRVSGGSSGGSGAALTANCCYGALGTDSGGSVRIPAAYCGVVALKPTYGLVSMRGILSSSRSFDTCGPMARSVEDVALLLDAIAGYDPLDIASAEHSKESYRTSMRQAVSGLRVGIPRNPYFDDLDPEIEKSIEAALKVLGTLTHGIKDVALPAVDERARLEVEGAEYVAYHHLLQRQGYAGLYRKFRPDLLIENRALPAEKCHEALDAYVQRRWDLELLRRTADQVFADFDVVALPTMKFMPPRIEDVLKHGRNTGPKGQTLYENTAPFNWYGWPAISLPCGFSSSAVPIGLMIAGPKFSEGKLLALAHAYEQHGPQGLKEA